MERKRSARAKRLYGTDAKEQPCCNVIDDGTGWTVNRCRLHDEAPNMLDALKDAAVAIKPIKEGKRDGATFGNLSIAADNIEAAIEAATS